jgi:tetratricopeptide (TPR) repeat protein
MAVSSLAYAESDNADGVQQSEDPLVRAREAYSLAVEAYEAKRYKDAIDLFQRADQLAPNPAFSFNIGIAYEDMGDAAMALRFYRAYVRLAPNAPDRDDVDLRVERLELQLKDKGVQQVTIFSTPPGATVAIDGSAVGVTPWTGEITPGHHQVSLQHRGYRDETRSFDLPPSRAIDVPVTLTKETRDPAQRVSKASAELPREAWYARIEPVTWGVLGAGVLCAGGAVGFELARASSEDKARTEPVQVKAASLLDTAESHQLWATVFAVTGGALTLTGATLAYFDLTAKSRDVAALNVGCEPSGCLVGYAGLF